MKIWIAIKYDAKANHHTMIKGFASADKASELAMKLTEDEKSEVIVYLVDSVEVEV